jgi:hypothetical protein
MQSFKALHNLIAANEKPRFNAVDSYLATSISALLKHYRHHNPDHQREITESGNSRPVRFRIISG